MVKVNRLSCYSHENVLPKEYAKSVETLYNVQIKHVTGKFKVCGHSSAIRTERWTKIGTCTSEQTDPLFELGA